MKNMRCVALVASVPLAGTAMAEMVLLDIPSGNGSDIVWSSASGAASPFFSLESTNFNFANNGYGTQGVVWAWDTDADENAVGILDLTVQDPQVSSFSEVQFEISGYLDRFSRSRIRVFADGAEVYSEAWGLYGQSHIGLISVDLNGAQNFRIELENTENWALTGLDNIEVSSSVVPAPGALALLGLAGVAGSRRRRR